MKLIVTLALVSGSHAEQTAKIMIAFEETLLDQELDLVVLVDDVNSTVACGLVPRKIIYNGKNVSNDSADLELGVSGISYKPPLFFVHGPSGQVLDYYNLASHLGEDQPFYGMQAQGLNRIQPAHTRIEDMAAHYVKEMRTLHPHGPYYLGGFCFGGQVAFEMARQLQKEGQKADFLGLFDSFVRRPSESSPMTGLFPSKAFVRKMKWHLRNLVLLERGKRLTYLLTRMRNLKTQVQMSLWNLVRRFFSYIGRPSTSWFQLRDLRLIHYQAGRDYVPGPYPGRVTIFLSKEAPEKPSEDPRLGWTKLAAGGSEVHWFTGRHETMLHQPHRRVVAEKLKICLEKTQATVLQT